MFVCAYGKQFMLDWKIKLFDQLSLLELYAILKLRMQVFMLEQDSLYLDIDDLDQKSFHLVGKDQGEVVAYARVMFDSITRCAKIGRVVVDKNYRGMKIGNLILSKLLEHISENKEIQLVTLSSQVVAQDIYKKFGFEPVGEPFDDGGILHIKMQKDLRGNLLK